MVPPLLKDASFELRRGEILGIAGLMGSGRTPLLRAIFGLERPTNGTVTINKKLLTGGRNTTAMRLIEGFGYLSEDRKGDGLTLNLSVADNTTLTQVFIMFQFWLDRSLQAAQPDRETRCCTEDQNRQRQTTCRFVIRRQSAKGDRRASTSPGRGHTPSR